MVASTDVLVEGRHFRTDWSSGYDVGRKAAAANLADVVAMGARPTALLVGLACPGELSVSWVEALADGLAAECALLHASVVGGDVVAAPVITVAVTALGDLQGRAPLTRSGASPGDRVIVTGVPGAAAGGLALLEAGRSDHPLVSAHRRPTPDYAAAQRIADRASAMIDVSDGLVADLGHVARASGVRIEIAAARLPMTPELDSAGRLLGVDPVVWALTGGDDHGFAATVPRPLDGSGVATIGAVLEVVPGESPGVVVIDADVPARTGHEHFPSPPSRSGS